MTPTVFVLAWLTIVTFGDAYLEPWNRTNTLVIHDSREACEAYIAKFEQWERAIIEFLALDKAWMSFEVSACIPYLQETPDTGPQPGEVETWPHI